MSTPLDAGGGLLAKLVLGIASATVIGGGTMVLNLHRNDAVQDTRIERNERTLEKIDGLDNKLNEANARMAELSVRLDMMKESRNEPRNE